MKSSIGLFASEELPFQRVILPPLLPLLLMIEDIQNHLNIRNGKSLLNSVYHASSGHFYLGTSGKMGGSKYFFLRVETGMVVLTQPIISQSIKLFMKLLF